MIDFLVIGGGIAGVSAAARLSEVGQVVLLEGEDALAYHASGRSAAMFEENYGKPSTIELNRASRAFHQGAEVLGPRGLMLIGGKQDADAFAHDLETMKLEEISTSDARSMIPILRTDAVDRAAHDPHAWDIDTDKLVQTFVRMARQNGAEIVPKALVTAISRDGTGWIVQVGGTDYTARNIVNAAGAWGDEIAKMAGIAPIGLTPLRRSMARIPAPGGHDVSRWPMVFGAGETWYAKPDAGALIVSPADEDPVTPHDAFADDMVLAEGLARYEANVTEPVTRLLSSWAGLRTFTPDRTLVLGPDPAVENFIWCAGQGGYGMQSAPAASQLLADLVAGRQPELPASTVKALTPQRLRAHHA
ncbi:NAD(P)/FAD-dependent oxidoreductase [Yoonia litorea]|uniref:Glycine/D-amino acid oxidase n=1 Tax=Yoonia litorea TaxID=1123755 RepID=A0A1I6N1G4_9RHOB|nr:FAD-binding oxidoreductase [Yoonia litorea]SFS21770.1 Glycine/D-amino acid oxidase [Yoonia litorea]